MPPRRKGKAKKVTERQKTIENYIFEFDRNVQLQIKHMEESGEELLSTIDELFRTALVDIDEKYHNLTLDQISMAHIKTPTRIKNTIQSATSYAKFKCMTEEKKIPSSCSSRATPSLAKRISFHTRKKTVPARNPNASMRSRPQASSCMQMKRKGASTVLQSTPLVKKKMRITNTPFKKFASKTLRKAVTPKFDPKTPLANSSLRKPRKGEVIMSLSGSPLQNCANGPILDQPGLFLKLGGGRVVDISDKTQLTDVMDEIDLTTRANLLMVHEKLAGLMSK